jgi:hypothetical protein
MLLLGVFDRYKYLKVSLSAARKRALRERIIWYRFFNEIESYACRQAIE